MKLIALISTAIITVASSSLFAGPPDYKQAAPPPPPPNYGVGFYRAIDMGANVYQYRRLYGELHLAIRTWKPKIPAVCRRWGRRLLCRICWHPAHQPQYRHCHRQHWRGAKSCGPGVADYCRLRLLLDPQVQHVY